MEKTWKRETAMAQLAFLAGLTVWGVFEPGAAASASMLAPYIFIFAGGAFALDAAAKQLRRD